MSRSLDFKFLCQRQAQKLVNLLSLISVWGVFHKTNRQQRQVIKAHHCDRSNDNLALVTYLESEQWLDTTLATLELILLPLSDVQNCPNQAFIYVFFLPQPASESVASNPNAEINSLSQDYFLFWSDRELSPPECETLECYSNGWVDYWYMCQYCEQQQKEYQALAEVISKGEHQLRNSLALINLYAENIYLGLPSGTLQEQARVIRETAIQLTTNLHNLLHHNQKISLQLVTYDLKEILQETLELLAAKITQKQLKIEYPQNSATLAIDRWQIKQVLENLLINAIEFSPYQGTISCRWQVFQQEVLVEICDRGPGLSPQDLVEAFTPFYSRRKGGTGLGLTIAKKAILDHKGNIWAENLLEGGAVFSFTLPRNLH